MTIPADQIVSVRPSVISAGGNAIDLNGLMLTQNPRVPFGSVLSYPSKPAVSAALGADSADTDAASIYFGSYTGALASPGQILVARYPLTAISAFLRSASLAAISITELQTFNDILSVNVDGYLRSASINLSGALTFSLAASTIQTELNTASGTQTLAAFTASISGNVMTVTGTIAGTIIPGQTVTGSNTPTGSVVLEQLTGLAGGTGTYQLGGTGGTVDSQTLTTIPTPVSVAFDSVTAALTITSGVTGTLSTMSYATGSLSGDLFFTQALGAVLSQGADAATPSDFMDNLVSISSDWATFFTNFDPDGGSGNTDKLEFAAWTAGTSDKYAYLAGDSDITPTLSVPASASLGQLVKANSYGGVCCIYDPNIYKIPAFFAGIGASLKFDQPNGRATFALKQQDGLLPTVTDGTVAQNLLSNGYNYYGAYATANTQFILSYNGSISGDFLWLDSYLNQVWLTANLQLAILDFMRQVGAIPYNALGFGLIANAVASVIAEAGAFGVFSPGVSLSSAQIAAVNAQAGANIAQALQQQGWYLIISDPGPVARQNRQSPICKFWYVDGEAVQQVTLLSVQL